MANSSACGFREVLIDQPFTGKWMEVDMNLGGGHTTFQGKKFSDFAGGFSYKNGKPVVQNRCIYWRTINDTLELTELSMNYNLVDNQTRYIFQDSPIVGPITIQETETSVVILVATVTSVNRFIFTHPKRIQDIPGEKISSGSNRPSIFYQVCNKPQMNFKSFNLYENAINIPVPLSAACQYVERGPSSYNNQQHSVGTVTGECVFAFSYESGSIRVYKVSRDDSVADYDLKQSGVITRFFSGITSQLMRSGTSSTEAAIGMSFFIAKAERNKSIELITLSMNGKLTLWHCDNLDLLTEWTSIPCGTVDSRFTNGDTDSSMLLRKIQDSNSGLKELPLFAIYLPETGFSLYQVIKTPSRNASGQKVISYSLALESQIEFKDEEIIDFSLTPEYLFLLVSNPEEETEWRVQFIRRNGSNKNQGDTFFSALLEPIPEPDVEMAPSSSCDSKEFYVDLIFNKCFFNAQTIIKALSMFRKEDDEPIRDKDWESLKITATNIIFREIGLATSHTDFGVADDEFANLSLQFWMQFYNSCVEYHIHTIKPLGLFYESNTKMVCVVKKSRVSFLRPTSFLETLYYFPDVFTDLDSVEQSTDEPDFEISMLIKYMDVIVNIQSILDEDNLIKLETVMASEHAEFSHKCEELVRMVTDNDRNRMEKRESVSELLLTIKELENFGSGLLKRVINSLHSWDNDHLNSPSGEEFEFDGEEAFVAESFMTSRIGSHLTFNCLKQLLNHRYMIARGTMLLQAFITVSSSSNDQNERVLIDCDLDDQYDALSATKAHYALLQLAEEPFVSAKPFVKDRGLKVANILKVFTGDNLKPMENFMESIWPMKTMENFLVSQIGGRFIRRRITGDNKKSSVLSCAEAAGKALYAINEHSFDRPFDEFLISSCQHSTLLRYANYMSQYFVKAKLPSKILYLATANLFLDQTENALEYFRSIKLKSDEDRDPYFCVKILELSPTTNEFICTADSRISYFVKIISIFQVFNLIPAVQKLAQDGLDLAVEEGNDQAATQMCSLAFKSALFLRDYDSAYKNIRCMPSHDGSGPPRFGSVDFPEDSQLGGRYLSNPQRPEAMDFAITPTEQLQAETADVLGSEPRRYESSEKLASLRMFVSRILQEKEVDVLVSLDLNDRFSYAKTVRQEVEDILFAQANLSDPLCTDGVYQMLYLYHLSRENYHKAASVMYYRAMRIGDKGEGLEALEAQKESYLDVVTCLSHLEEDSFRYVIQHTGASPEFSEPSVSLNGDKVPVMSENETTILRTYDDIQRELELIVLLVKLSDRIVSNPVKMLHFYNEAYKTVDCLIIYHYYDDAIKLAKLWNLNVTPIVSAFADVCANLVHNILPQSEDPFEYIRHNDSSELPTSDTGVIELAFRLLKSYLEKLEKPLESELHMEVAMKFIAADIELPQWLLASYKKKNSAQLLRCYMSYGLWEEATELAMNLIDATLGRRNSEEFDFSIKKISAHDATEPVIPYGDINILASELEDRILDEPKLKSLLEGLLERVKLYIFRCRECQNERRQMFSI